MSSSDDDALALAAFAIILKRKHLRKNALCGVKIG